MNRLNADRHSRTTRGFTMFEALVALAILGLLLGIGLPSLDRLIARTVAGTNAHLLYTTYQFARNEAVKSGKTVTICGSDDGAACRRAWSKYLLVFFDADKDQTATASELVRRVELNNSRGHYVTRVGTHARHVNLKYNGRSSRSGRLIYCDSKSPSFSRQVVFNIPGRPYFGRHPDKDGHMYDSNGTKIDCG